MNNTFDTFGPFGLPLKDQQAKALDQILAGLPKGDAFTPRRLSSTRGLAEWLPEARADVSWITMETPDHAGDLVRAAGMDDSLFRLNPIVTLNHSYATPPVGRSQWRKKMLPPSTNGPGSGSAGRRGIKAKTVYPPCPDDWSGVWPADHAFQLLEAGLLRGKSIGFVPLQLHEPSAAERAADPALAKVRCIIDRWLLLEYACCFLPTQPLALVEELSKSWPGPMLEALQLTGRGPTPAPALDPARKQLAAGLSAAPAVGQASIPCPFATWTTLAAHLPTFLRSPEFANLVQRTFQKALGMV